MQALPVKPVVSEIINTCTSRKVTGPGGLEDREVQK